MKKAPRIIYFVDSVNPSEKQLKKIAKLGPNVVVRNSQYVGPDHKPEKCDGVAGTVPKIYSDFPKGEEAVKAYFQEMDDSADTVPEKAGKKTKEKEEKSAEWNKNV